MKTCNSEEIHRNFVAMKTSRKKQALDFEIDILTNSIKEAKSGNVLNTNIIRIDHSDEVNTQRVHWVFDWALEINDPQREVYALVLKDDPAFWQGLVSCEDGGDHVYLHLLESAEWNKGHEKRFMGVAGNLVAFLCRTSFEKGYSGIVVLEPKTRLIEHYQMTLGAQLISPRRMFIPTTKARELVTRYFPDFL